MRHLLAFCLFAGAFLHPLVAQVSGFNGKHLIVKTDLMHLVPLGAFSLHAEAELAILRHFSVGFSYHQARPSTLGLSFQSPDTLGTYSLTALGGYVRIYRQLAMNAPHGNYFFIGRNYGAVDIQAQRVFEEQNPIGPSSTVQQEVTLRSPYVEWQAGFGDQRIWKSRFVIDVAMFINYYNIPMGENGDLVPSLTPLRSPSNLISLRNDARTLYTGTSVGFRFAVGVLLI